MGNATPSLLCRGALAVVVVVAGLLAASCSLVEMPSNRSLEGPPQSTPSATPSTSESAAPPVLDAQTAERESANAKTASYSFREQVRGAVRLTVSGLVVVQRTPLRISEQVTAAAGGRTLQLSAIISRRAMYLQAGLTPTAPGSWIKVPLPRLDRAALLYDVQNENPMSQVSLLQAGYHPRLVGHQTVDGVLTSKYTGFVTPAAALAALPSAQRAQFAAAASLITGNIRYVLWIGPGNHLRKLRMAEDVSGSTVTLTYLVNWINRPVHITIPRATAVASLPGRRWPGSPPKAAVAIGIWPYPVTLLTKQAFGYGWQSSGRIVRAER